MVFAPWRKRFLQKIPPGFCPSGMEDGKETCRCAYSADDTPSWSTDAGMPKTGGLSVPLFYGFRTAGQEGGDKNNATFFQNWKICGNTGDVRAQKCPGRMNSRGIPQYERSPCMMTSYIIFGLFLRSNLFLQKQQQKNPGNSRGFPAYHKRQKKKKRWSHITGSLVLYSRCVPNATPVCKQKNPPAGMVAAGGRNGAGEREKARPLWNACKYDYTTIAHKVKWHFANVFRRLSKGFRRLCYLYATDWTRLCPRSSSSPLRAHFPDTLRSSCPLIYRENPEHCCPGMFCIV